MNYTYHNLQDVIKATNKIRDEFKRIGMDKEAEDIATVLKTYWTTSSEALEMILESLDQVSLMGKSNLSSAHQKLLEETYKGAEKLLNQ